MRNVCFYLCTRKTKITKTMRKLIDYSIIFFSCYCVQPPAVEKEEELKDLKDRAQVRMLLWLGLEKDQEKWTECCGGGEVAVFAETVSGV